jgi:threonine dehydrogenase-like Zn-dependent dehydrogenase
MKHLICEVTRTGDYILSTPEGVVVEKGTCKEDTKGDKVTINPNVAWAALQRRSCEKTV